jgi:hypothetical protein
MSRLAWPSDYPRVPAPRAATSRLFLAATIRRELRSHAAIGACGELGVRSASPRMVEGEAVPASLMGVVIHHGGWGRSSAVVFIWPAAYFTLSSEASSDLSAFSFKSAAL